MMGRIPVLIGLGQGLLLLMMHEAIHRKWQLISAPEFAYPAYAMVLLLPVIGLLGLRFGKLRELLVILAGMAGLLLVLGVHAGHIAYAEINDNTFPSIFAFGSSMLVLTYIALPFLQSRLRRGRFVPPYSDLYEFGWLNTLVLVVAGVFTGVVWALLGLWAALFDVLHIKFFSQLFFDRHFVYPATGVMFAYGMALGLQRFNVGIVQKVDFLSRALMVLVALIVVLFLLALLVSGLQPLWDTGKATLLLLWLQLFTVLFINGLFQRGDSEREEGALVRWSMALSMLALPVFSIICIWALYLRVGQHGWTVDRVWAALITAVLALYAVGYAVSALRGVLQHAVRFSAIAQANIVTALCILFLLALVNSPLLSPVVVAANSQMERLLEGKVAAANFDFNYLRFNLGRVGMEKLKQLQSIEGHADSDVIHRRAGQALAWLNRWDGEVKDSTDMSKLVEVYPADRQMDSGVAKLLQDQRRTWPYSGCFHGSDTCLLLYADMDGDGTEEAILASSWGARLLVRQNGQWLEAGRLEGAAFSSMREAIRSGSARVEKSPWRVLKGNGRSWSVVPDK